MSDTKKKRRPRDRKTDKWIAEKQPRNIFMVLPPPNNWMVRNSRNGNVAVVRATQGRALGLANELNINGYIED